MHVYYRPPLSVDEIVRYSMVFEAWHPWALIESVANVTLLLSSVTHILFYNSCKCKVTDKRQLKIEGKGTGKDMGLLKMTLRHE